MSEIIARLDRIEKMLEEIAVNQSQNIPGGISPQLAAAIVGGPDAVRAINKKRLAIRRKKTMAKKKSAKSG